jgi:hypothetical protein
MPNIINIFLFKAYSLKCFCNCCYLELIQIKYYRFLYYILLYVCKEQNIQINYEENETTGFQPY